VIAVDLFGWIAGALVLATFCLRTMIPLRCVAIASNLAFIAYGLMASALPIVVLHLALLPMNALRLREMKALASRIKSASRGAPCIDALVPHMRVRRFPAGTALFEEGDDAKEVYLVLEGRVRIAGRNARIGAGQLVGEIGVLAPGKRHPEGAVCETVVTLAAICEDKLWEVFHRSPEFGACLLRLIVSRYHDRDEAFPSDRPARSSFPSTLPRSRSRDGYRSATAAAELSR